MSFGWLMVPALADSPIVLDAGTIALLIPITAIVFGCTAGMVNSIIKHRERMAKIGMGIDPDAPRSVAGQLSDSTYGR